MENKVCTLMYHDVYLYNKNESGFNYDSANSYKISKDVFEDHVKRVFQIVEDRKIEREYIRFTFDDGGGSFITIVAEILEKYGFKGYFFIATKYIGSSAFLTKEDIKCLYKRGHFIGAHSHTHRQMMNSLDKKELFEDWKTSINILSNIIGAPITIASLPNGYSSKKIISVLYSLGVKDIYTSEPCEIVKYNRNNQRIIGRYGIKDGMNAVGIEQLICCKTIKNKIVIRKKTLNLLKKILGRLYIYIREYMYKIWKIRN